MSVLVDDRLGSRDLVAPLRALGVPAEAGRLESGDVEIVGNGPAGRPVLVGIEYKSLAELLGGIETGHTAEQLRVMHSAYEVSTLLVYGMVRPGEQGELLAYVGREWRPAGFGARPWTYCGLHSYLTSVRVRLGVGTVLVASQREAAWWIKACWLAWCSKEWEQHRSHLALQDASLLDYTAFDPIKLRRRIAAQLPGIGAKRALSVEARFASTKEMICASEADWREVEGVGKATAAKIVAAVGSE